MDTKKFGTIGVIGRFKPLHLGAASMLEAACQNAEEVEIGIGSANKYDNRNPFTKEETKGMIDAYLNGKYQNYSVIFVPDFGHIPKYQDGTKWKEYVSEHFGSLDAFITSNGYVAKLLKDTYRIIQPVDIIALENRIPIRASMVRMAMARGEDYARLLPDEVTEYLEKNNLVERFKHEFGLETLASLNTNQWCRPETSAEEAAHVKGTNDANYNPK